MQTRTSHVQPINKRTCHVQYLHFLLYFLLICCLRFPDNMRGELMRRLNGRFIESFIDIWWTFFYSQQKYSQLFKIDGSTLCFYQVWLHAHIVPRTQSGKVTGYLKQVKQRIQLFYKTAGRFSPTPALGLRCFINCIFYCMD